MSTFCFTFQMKIKLMSFFVIGLTIIQISESKTWLNYAIEGYNSYPNRLPYRRNIIQPSRPLLSQGVNRADHHVSRAGASYPHAPYEDYYNNVDFVSAEVDSSLQNFYDALGRHEYESYGAAAFPHESGNNLGALAVLGAIGIAVAAAVGYIGYHLIDIVICLILRVACLDLGAFAEGINFSEPINQSLFCREELQDKYYFMLQENIFLAYLLLLLG